MRFDRPWLQLYEPTRGCLLAQRISHHARACKSDEHASDDAVSRMSFECWLEVAAHLPVSDFAAVCRLASVCRALRAIGRHSDLWERCCRYAFSHPGFTPCDDILRCYGWSWRRMFRERCRLRTDGIYFIATTKILKSTPVLDCPCASHMLVHVSGMTTRVLTPHLCSMHLTSITARS